MTRALREREHVEPLVSDQDAARVVDTYAPGMGRGARAAHVLEPPAGCEPALVLHGGGNASVKAPWRTVSATTCRRIFVKASGFDMASIEPDGHPGARPRRTAAPARRWTALDDEAMVNEVRRALFDHAEPEPVDRDARARVPAGGVRRPHARGRDPDADQPARRPGARARRRSATSVGRPRLRRAGLRAGEGGCRGRGRRRLRPRPRADAAWPHHVGRLGARARTSAHRIWSRGPKRFVARASAARRHASTVPDRRRVGRRVGPPRRRWRPILRGQLARATGDARPAVGPGRCCSRSSTDDVLALLERRGRERRARDAGADDRPSHPDEEPAALDRRAGVGRRGRCSRRSSASAIEAYAAVIRRLRRAAPGGHAGRPRPVRPAAARGAACRGSARSAPGANAREAAIARDITAQTLQVKAAIAAMGAYEGLSERELFLMEYRGVQHAKLAAPAGALADRVALITGAAGAIGDGHRRRACSRQGCHVVVTDLAGAALGVAGCRARRGVPRPRRRRPDGRDRRRVGRRRLPLRRPHVGRRRPRRSSTPASRTWPPLTVMDVETFRKLERVNIDGTLLVLAECGRHFARQADRRRHRAGVDQERLRAGRQVRRLQRHQGRGAPAGADREPRDWPISTSA